MYVFFFFEKGLIVHVCLHGTKLLAMHLWLYIKYMSNPIERDMYEYMVFLSGYAYEYLHGRLSVSKLPNFSIGVFFLKSFLSTR